MPKRLYIQTVGCQMNVLDSELIASDLLQAGYELVDSPRKADTILLNTCSVRQHAEDKVYSALGRLRPLKQRRPEMIIGVVGCMAQKDRGLIFHRASHVDLVVGPGQLGRLRELLEQAAAGQGPITAVQPVPPPSSVDTLGATAGLSSSADNTVGQANRGTPRFRSVGALCLPQVLIADQPPRLAALRPVPQQAMLRIMLGCDKGCAYCIVPRVRGPEQSRPVAQVEAEARRLAAEGCLAITLLGQAVNSYHDTSTGRSLRLADLLCRLHDIEGLRRLRFVTNHPRHMTGELLQAVRDLPKVTPYLHVPAQSGSTEVLRRMRRGYTSDQYREIIERIRQTVPGAAVTSDFIVGFCGETEEDFRQTVDLVRWARLKNSFIFKYSPRPGTPAAELYPNDVPEAVKRRRNNELLAVQNAISLEDNQPWVGRQAEVLVEGPSKSARKRAADPAAPTQLVGRTTCDRIVVFDGPPSLAGKIIPVHIHRAETVTLFGRLAESARGATAVSPGGTGVSPVSAQAPARCQCHPNHEIPSA
ncbi:MAG: MiaB/RimO family radical SAM methylthiotransferase [Thermoguttaceae bacterium]|jgi:tRNA-2-methylthio-N6-dimethylallyladenosine synthase